MKRNILAAIFIAGVIGPASLLFGQGTVFTYQGQLKVGGSPASGAYDMTFRLFDAESAGNQVGVDFPLVGVAATGGLFTVPLDFGASMFDGTPRWLEIEVNAVVLTPRQALTATPYAQTCVDANNATYAGYANSAGYANAPWLTSGADLYYSAGNVGIGTATPTAKLELSGTPGVDGLKFPDGSIQTTAAGLGGGGSNFWTGSGTNIFNNNGGKVGIGTTAPASKLDIEVLGSGAEALRLGIERPWVFRQDGVGSGAYLQLYSLIGLKQFEVTASGNTNVATFQANDADPRVGIGTRTPLAKLDITQNIIGQDLLRFSTERPWNFRQIYTGPSAGLQLYSTSGQKAFEITCLDGTNVATFMADQTNPRVGIGTTAPVSKLDIVGQDGLRITGFQPFLTLRDSSNNNARARIQTANSDISIFTEASFATGIAPFTIRNSGTTSVKILEIRGGADLSEQFEVSNAPTAGNRPSISASNSEIQPGMVVSIDAANPGKLVVSNKAYDRRVAGIISGAGGVNTGMLMGQQGSIADGHHPVALTGRVYAMCDAGTGPIDAGDLLTTSDTPGCAMKAADSARAQGAIIGKAMSSLTTGRGLVLVLVTLQ